MLQVRFSICFIAALALTLSALTAHAQTTRPADRLMSWQLIGGAMGNAPEDRFIPKHWFTRGWQTAKADVIQPQLTWGVRRIILRNPFGTRLDPAGGHYVEYTQYDQAVKQTPWAVSGFVVQIKTVTSRGNEIVAYVGNPDDDLAIRALVTPRERWEALGRNVEPYVKAGCSVALDACADKGRDSLSFAVANYLRACGVKVYVEPRPTVSATHWFDYPIMAHSDFWDRSDPAKHPDAAPIYARNDQLTGEIILLVPHQADYTWAGRGWDKQWALDTLKTGATAGLSMARVLELQRFDPAKAFTRADLGQ